MELSDLKRIIAALLAAVLVLSTFSVAIADGEKAVGSLAATESDAVKEMVTVDGLTEIPVVLVSGDGVPLVNKDGEQALQYKNFLSDAYRDEVINTLLDGLKNLLYPMLVDGLLTNNWDNFYDTLYVEIGRLFEETLLDNNGEIPKDPESPAYNSSLDPKYYQYNVNAVSRTYPEGYRYHAGSFQFFYDWRLDPFYTVEKLHEYIQGVKKATGSEKVGLIGRCLGSSIVMTYAQVYGMDDIIGVAINGSVVNGAEVLSEPISGQFNIHLDAVKRFIEDSNGTGLFAIDTLVTDLLDMVYKSGLYDVGNTIVRATIYQKLVQGVTSALARSTFYTWPTYWTGVAPEDYQQALNYAFGPEGSELRKEYAGLIEKLDHYDREVRQKLPSIYEKIEKGGNLGIMSKYEFQIAPIVESSDKIGDQFASVEYTSLGATTAPVHETLSDEYIAQRVAEGKGKYISPDKQIDASTCAYPDYTWFVKGSSHSYWSFAENAILQEVVTASEQLTVDDTAYTQFFVYDYDTDSAEAMTEENCDKVYHAKEEKPKNIFEKISAFAKSFAKFMKTLFERIAEKIEESKQQPQQ